MVEFYLILVIRLLLKRRKLDMIRRHLEWLIWYARTLFFFSVSLWLAFVRFWLGLIYTLLISELNFYAGWLCSRWRWVRRKVEKRDFSYFLLGYVSFNALFLSFLFLFLLNWIFRWTFEYSFPYNLPLHADMGMVSQRIMRQGFINGSLRYILSLSSTFCLFVCYCIILLFKVWLNYVFVL